MNTRPEKFCDIVMKGGITSGVVYPRAVTELARSFTLKSVGGTSAGAIAAAAAAAAESARARHPAADAFDPVRKLPELLSAKNSSGHTNLFTFFQPQPGTARLFHDARAVEIPAVQPRQCTDDRSAHKDQVLTQARAHRDEEPDE